MLERTNAITSEVLEPITFVLAYPTLIQLIHVPPHCETCVGYVVRRTEPGLLLNSLVAGLEYVEFDCTWVITSAGQAVGAVFSGVCRCGNGIHG